MKRTSLLLVLLSCLLGAAWGCGAEDEGDTNSNNGEVNNGGVNNGEVNNGEVNNGEVNNGEVNNGEGNNGALPVGPYGGQYLVGIAIAPLNGLVLPFQLEIDSRLNGEAVVFKEVLLRATKEDGSVSEVLASLQDVPVVDDAFVLDFGVSTLPGEFTPTGSDVDVAVAFQGEVREEGLICGGVTGEIITFGFDLAGSTFGAIPWEQREEGLRSSCEGGPMEEIPRLTAEECPALEAGTVSGFMSAGRSRSFKLFVPEQIAEEGAPVMFVFHGIGGSADGILEGSGLPELAQEMGFVVVAPEGFVVDGSALWNVVSAENEDVAFFDDMLTCVKEAVSVDNSRVYVTGHSNGGLFSSNLLRLRSEALAAAAPISGGWFVNLEAAANPIPTLVTWGGVIDQAFEQDFNQLSLGLIEGLKEDGHFVVACDHGQGHGFPPSVWPWLVEFLLSHKQGQEASPLAGGLPDTFADYCEIVSP